MKNSWWYPIEFDAIPNAEVVLTHKDGRTRMDIRGDSVEAAHTLAKLLAILTAAAERSLENKLKESS